MNDSWQTHTGQFYLNGQWVTPLGHEQIDVINPATEQPIARIALGTAEDADRAVRAARTAFPAFAGTSVAERRQLIEAVINAFERRKSELAAALTAEMGAPVGLANGPQTQLGIDHLREMLRVLQSFQFVSREGAYTVVREAIGVVAMITPWNWPVHQIMAKIAPALGSGCTMVLKPSEVAPLTGLVVAQVMHEAGVPAGVFNLVNGIGTVVGEALASHPEVDMVSFTGSVRGGVAVARAAADTVKRVHQELGGKSANILLPDADLHAALRAAVFAVTLNTGQCCNAPTRLLVSEAQLPQVLEILRSLTESVRAGDPTQADSQIGPLVSLMQFERVQEYIRSGIEEGATVVIGGLGRPPGLSRGYYVRPTIFANVKSDMRIAREEIFGPVLVIQTYRDVEQAIDMANDSVLGLAAYVSGRDEVQVARVAARLRAGNVYLNGSPPHIAAPYGGYRRSGNGREYGEYGLAEFLETKALIGPGSQALAV